MLVCSIYFAIMAEVGHLRAAALIGPCELGFVLTGKVSMMLSLC